MSKALDDLKKFPWLMRTKCSPLPEWAAELTPIIEALEAEMREAGLVMREIVDGKEWGHDDNCSMDDTCDCSRRQFNARINAVCNLADVEASHNEHASPWKPKVGDLVRYLRDSVVFKVTEIDQCDDELGDEFIVKGHPTSDWITVPDLEPASPPEPAKPVSDQCGKAAFPLIAGGAHFACVLPPGHSGVHQPGGNCFTHGEYVSEANKPPRCPKCNPEPAKSDPAPTLDGPEWETIRNYINPKLYTHPDNAIKSLCIALLGLAERMARNGR